MKQYLKLLMVREAKEVLGKKGSNLWILTLVLVATFMSIAFSEGSIVYLKDKMEDPFTMWIDIPIDGSSERFKNFKSELDKSEIQQKYGFSDVHGDREEYYDMQTDKYLRCRHFANIHAPLINKILEESNLVRNCIIDSAKLSDNSLGLFVTVDALKKLGFNNLDSIPPYIYYKAYNEQADTLGLELQEGKFLEIPLPLLAVVRRLPNNVDMMATNYLSEQPNNDYNYPFNFNVHPDYISTLRYFIPYDINLDDLVSTIKKVFPDSVTTYINCIEEENEQMVSWMPGKQIKLDFGQDPPDYTSQQWLAFNKEILETIVKENVIDAVITHAAPSFCELQSKNGLESWTESDTTLLSDIHKERAIMDDIYEALKGQSINHWCYGHFHQSWHSSIEGTFFKMLDIMELYEIR